MDGLDAVALELKAKGVDLLLEPVSLGDDVKISLVAGPDNVVIELSQDGKRR